MKSRAESGGAAPAQHIGAQRIGAQRIGARRIGPRSTGAPPGRARSSAGFTLIEVVIALAIAAIGLGALMAAAGQGLGNVSAADHYIEAVRRAQSHLAMAGVTQPPVVGETTGDDGGGYVWRVTIRSVAAHAPPPPSSGKGAAQPGQDAPRALALYTVDVVIGWREKNKVRSVSIQSQRTWPASNSHG